MTTEEDLEKVININNECTGDIEDEDTDHEPTLIWNCKVMILPIGVGKCQHLPKRFGENPKWKRLQAFFALLPSHYGKC